MDNFKWTNENANKLRHEMVNGLFKMITPSKNINYMDDIDMYDIGRSIGSLLFGNFPDVNDRTNAYMTVHFELDRQLHEVGSISRSNANVVREGMADYLGLKLGPPDTGLEKTLLI